MTKIEWTEKAWNPIVGCSVVSPGCTNCYAMRMAARLEAIGVEHYRGTTQPSKAGPVWTGKVALAPEKKFLEPLRRKKPTMYFVNSIGDLFHEGCPDEWIDRVFAVMALCPQHTFQVLTKRAERMRAYMPEPWGVGFAIEKAWAEVAYWRILKAAQGIDPSAADRAGLGGCNWWPLPNVWLGISCEDQTRADERIPHLLRTPAAVRFISAEPLLGPINLTHIPMSKPDEHSVFRTINALTGVRGHGGKFGYTETCDPIQPHLDWIIVGGESGPGARPMHPENARDIRDQCQAAGVPFFFKQWGEWRQATEEDERAGRTQIFGREGVATMIAVGKKRAGRLLDGCIWDEMPKVIS